jgi:hypothetical protein
MSIGGLIGKFLIIALILVVLTAAKGHLSMPLSSARLLWASTTT